jgi:hypothetical protein
MLAFVALSAIAGGIFGLRGAEGVPLEWLEGTPFGSYTIPSLILLIAVGGSAAFASFLVLRPREDGSAFGLAAGLILVAWITVQVSMIGYRSWMQPTYLGVGLTIVALALWARRRSG